MYVQNICLEEFNMKYYKIKLGNGSIIRWVSMNRPGHIGLYDDATIFSEIELSQNIGSILDTTSKANKNLFHTFESVECDAPEDNKHCANCISFHLSTSEKYEICNSKELAVYYSPSSIIDSQTDCVATRDYKNMDGNDKYTVETRVSSDVCTNFFEVMISCANSEISVNAKCLDNKVYIYFIFNSEDEAYRLMPILVKALNQVSIPVTHSHAFLQTVLDKGRN
jgi:hypothetical protein